MRLVKLLSFVRKFSRPLPWSFHLLWYYSMAIMRGDCVNSQRINDFDSLKLVLWSGFCCCCGCLILDWFLIHFIEQQLDQHWVDHILTRLRPQLQFGSPLLPYDFEHQIAPTDWVCLSCPFNPPNSSTIGQYSALSNYRHHFVRELPQISITYETIVDQLKPMCYCQHSCWSGQPLA